MSGNATLVMPAQSADAAAPILFFDGECGFCDRSIRFAMSHDRQQRLHVATLSGETARKALAPFRAVLHDVDSTVLYWPASTARAAAVQIHSDAALSVLRLLGGVWGVLGVMGLLVPRWIRDTVYKAIAKRRLVWFGRVDACQLWPAEWRARVLP